MRDVMADLRAATDRLPEKFWGTVEFNFADGQVKSAKITETIQINRTPRDTRGNNERTAQQQRY